MAVRKYDDTAENHINGSCKESWCDKSGDRGCDVDWQVGHVVGSQSTSSALKINDYSRHRSVSWSKRSFQNWIAPAPKNRNICLAYIYPTISTVGGGQNLNVDATELLTYSSNNQGDKGICSTLTSLEDMISSRGREKQDEYDRSDQ